jgi:hypothetical protein
MSIQKTFDQRQHRDKTGPERDVIFTARGSAEASRRVWRTGTKIGYESQNPRPPDRFNVDFVDWPFSKLEDFSDMAELFDAHHNVVRSEKPRYAVAPDIDERVSFRDGIEWADELAEYAETVIVVPKTVMPVEVPDRFRVGMPCQNKYDPFPWKWTDYQPVEEVHLLGGSPVVHREIMKYYVPVESVDTTVPITSAKYGDYWNGEKWSPSDLGFYDCLARSYRHLRLMMNRDRRYWDPRCRNRKHDYVENFRENSPDADLWGQNEEPPVHGRIAYQ